VQEPASRREIEEMRNVSLPVMLRSLRGERGLRVEDVAKEIGVTPDTLSRVERGTRHPRVGTIAKLAQFYGLRPEELMSLEDTSYGPLALSR
jgi:transcriptional regulator with XRE-family HTH domain